MSWDSSVYWLCNYNSLTFLRNFISSNIQAWYEIILAFYYNDMLTTINPHIPILDICNRKVGLNGIYEYYNFLNKSFWSTIGDKMELRNCRGRTIKMTDKRYGPYFYNDVPLNVVVFLALLLHPARDNILVDISTRMCSRSKYDQTWMTSPVKDLALGS